jgi:hypothetical protein
MVSCFRWKQINNIPLHVLCPENKPRLSTHILGKFSLIHLLMFWKARYCCVSLVLGVCLYNSGLFAQENDIEIKSARLGTRWLLDSRSDDGIKRLGMYLYCNSLLTKQAPVSLGGGWAVHHGLLSLLSRLDCHKVFSGWTACGGL